MTTLTEAQRIKAAELGYTYEGIVSTPNENPHVWADKNGKWINEADLAKLL
jgi:hypothetical protein